MIVQRFVRYAGSPLISPGFVARAARCCAQWGCRPEGRGSVLHSTVSMTWVVAGSEAVQAIVRAAQVAAGRIGWSGVDGTAILVTLATVSAGLGAVVGGLAWALAGRVLRRLGRGP